MLKKGICIGILVLFLTCIIGFSAPAPLAVTYQQVNLADINLVFDINEVSLKEIVIQGEITVRPSLSEGGLLMEKGYPELPLVSRSVLLPNEGVVHLRWHVLAYDDVTNVLVAPSKGAVSRAVDIASVPYTFGAVYEQAAGWPEQPVSISEPYLIRACRGATVRVCPFEYFPASRTLRIFRKIEVQVICKGSGGVNSLTSTRKSGVRDDSDLFQHVYAGHFINYNSSAKRYTPLTRKGKMLIVSADDLVGAVQPLANWRNQMGIPTTIVPLSAIGSTSDQIKTFVQASYTTNDLAYLLLVGDGEDMPYPMANSGVDRGAADPTYSQLAGSDNYPDIFVGRFSGSSSNEIAIMVERTITYEQSPVVSGSAWYDRATGIASGEGEEGAPTDIEHMNAVRAGLMSNNYTLVDQIYDPNAQASTVATAVNAGRGVMNYVGHGDVTEWVTTGFDNADVNALTNTLRWPYLFDVACLNGDFVGNTCFSEAWIRASDAGKPTGALATYGSTIEQDWVPPMHAQTEFNRLLVQGNITEYGALCYNASMQMMDDYPTRGPVMFNTWIVFGDPSAQVRTKTPVALDVTHPETLVSLNVTTTVFGVEGALVSLSLNNECLGSAYTDDRGVAVVQLAQQPASDLLLTVTAFNAVPYTSTIFLWTILSGAGDHGRVTPAGLISVSAGSSTSFLVEADNGYYVSSFMTNNRSVPGVAGLTRYTSHWMNVQGTGVLYATFAGVTNETATNSTPIPWLRSYYTNEADLAQLELRAEEDTDGDGLLGWEEYMTATDPTVATSKFDVVLRDMNQSLQWWATTDRTYSVFYASNLVNGFTLLVGNLTTEEATYMSYTDTVHAVDSKSFYTIRVNMAE